MSPDSSNPYAAPDPAATNLQLNRRERAILEFYWQHRTASPTMLSMVAQSLPRWAVLMFVFGCMVALLTSLTEIPVTSLPVHLVSGIVAGAVLRDFSYFRATIRVWPTLQSIIDWPSVERKLTGSTGN